MLIRVIARGFPKSTKEVVEFIGAPNLPSLIRRFLYVQVNNDVDLAGEVLDLDICLPAPPCISVFPSALAVFYAPSDLSGVKGMKKERIC